VEFYYLTCYLKVHLPQKKVLKRISFGREILENTMIK
jgi:hypothetical protein